MHRVNTHEDSETQRGHQHIAKLKHASAEMLTEWPSYTLNLCRRRMVQAMQLAPRSRMRRRPTVTVVLAFCLCSTLLTTAPVAAATTVATVATAGDASISHDESSGTWTLSAAGTNLTLTLDSGRDFNIARIVTPSGTSWARSAIVRFASSKSGRRQLRSAARTSGFVLQDVSVETAGRARSS